MTRARRIRTLLLGTVACAAALVLGGLAAAPASAAIPAASPVRAAAQPVQPDLLPTLQQGSTGSAVVLWQRDLNTWINYPPASCRPTLTVDGIFGPATTNATKCFQSTVGITRDGIVGPQTRGVMCNFLWAIGSSLYNPTCV
jgi:peptidoglycan hydrolase-like protein with peptidoglycan-binding domain